MSIEKTDTTQSAFDADAPVDTSTLGEDTHSGKMVEISKTDLENLGGLLESFRTVLLGHEERLLDHEGRLTVVEQKKPVKLEIPRGNSR